MRRYGLGVVIGKFLPPHRGHKYLVDVASSQVEQLIVILCAKPTDTIAGELRAAWLRELHPGVEVLLVDDVYDPGDSAVWATTTIRWLGRAPDVAFTSEDYGPVWAALMGAAHVMVDKARSTVPCRATDIRNDPTNSLHWLESPVRAWMVPRIAVLGAESTGTTTLAKALAEHYGTCWVAEYGREYCQQLDDLFSHNWRTEEFIRIGTEQNSREDIAAGCASPVLICDTDSFATSVWHERYIGHRSSEVEALSRGRRYAHTFLTDVDIPFVQDGWRDGEAIRHVMHERFVYRLQEAGRAFTVLRGGPEQRLEGAVRVVDDIRAAWRF